MQRKNPRKIAWTVVFRRMHKKGITEEVAKKRSRRTVKYQRGVVGADLGAIAALRNQTPQARTQARLAAITKAKQEKKAKEDKKSKVCLSPFLSDIFDITFFNSLHHGQIPLPLPRCRNNRWRVEKEVVKVVAYDKIQFIWEALIPCSRLYL